MFIYIINIYIYIYIYIYWKKQVASIKQQSKYFKIKTNRFNWSKFVLLQKYILLNNKIPILKFQ